MKIQNWIYKLILNNEEDFINDVYSHFNGF